MAATTTMLLRKCVDGTPRARRRSTRKYAVYLTRRYCSRVVMSGADPADPATENTRGDVLEFTAGLSANALHGKRIGVLRNYWGAGEDPNAEAVFDQAIATLEAAGA